MTKHEIKFVLHTPQAYFTFAEQIFHIEDISLVPKERISLKKTKSYDLVFFLAGAEGLEVAPQKHSRIVRVPKRLAFLGEDEARNERVFAKGGNE